MKCPNCGTPNLDSVKFCENCGHPLKAHHDRPAEPQQTYQEPYQQPQQTYANYQPVNNYSADPYHGHKMKWYKFLVYFALIASAVLSVYNAITSFTTGSWMTYDDSAKVLLSGTEARDYFYALAPGLKTADICNGIAALLNAALVLLAWYYLFKLKKSGPMCYYIYQAFSTLTGIGYSIWTYMLAKDIEGFLALSILASVFGSVAIGIVMIVINVVYFNKRKDVFVN